MAIEIEHKYLVTDASYIDMATSSAEIRQGYLSTEPGKVVRIRTYGNQGFVTIKGLTRDSARLEFEYEIPVEDAVTMLKMCPSVIEKRRWIVPYGGFIWEVDEFGGNCKGLTIAEIELPSVDTVYPLPPFVGENVTGKAEYYNSVISRR